jgi:hypothetical protein
MTASNAHVFLQLPPPIAGAPCPQVAASSREIIAWARASAQSGVAARHRPLLPQLPWPETERPRRPVDLAMLTMGQAAFLGVAIIGVASMIAG